MDTLTLITANLLTPMVLCFGLGLVAGRLGSDLRLPRQLYESIIIYLLLAIGLKGGEIAENGLASLVLPGLVSIGPGALIPVYAYPVLSRVGLAFTVSPVLEVAKWMERRGWFGRLT